MLPTISVLLPFAASAAMKADARRDVIVAMKQTKERKPSKSVQTFKEKLPSERQLQLGQKDDLLNKVGVLLVGGSIAYIAATGGDSKAPKQLKKKRKQPRLTRKDMTASPPTRSRKASFAVTEDDDDDEEEEAEVDGSGGRVSSWQRQPDERLQKQMRSIMVPSSPDELFGDDESIDDIFGDADTEPDSPRIEKRKASAASPASRDGPEPASPPLEVERVEHISPMLGQRAGRTSAAAAREPAGKSSAYSAGDSAEPSLPPYATIIPAPEVSKVESVTSRAAAASRTEAAPAAAPGAARVGSSESGRAEEESSPSPPPPPQKKPGMFGRLFGQKPGGGRPTDLAKALSGSDSGSGGGGAGDEEAQRELRAVIGSCLSVQVPAGTFPELEPGGEFATSCADAFDSAEEKRIAAIKDVMQQFDMSEQEAGEAFAEVASAMIVRLVDQAAKALDTSKAAKECVLLN